MEILSKKEWDRESIAKEDKLIYKEIKDHLNHIFH
tara:strand:- start:2177 stop:2281 length:105 start_codon:yes stop_codon:yes gene_type:complete